MGNSHLSKREIAIAGGGPAGAIAAILLARAGAQVTLFQGRFGADRVEGAGQRLVAALRAQGLAVEGLGPLVERRVDWGSLTGAPNREHLLARPRFDAGLVAQAADEGVQVVRTPIKRVSPGRIETADGTVTAGLVFEARGRRAPVARSRRRGVPTVSIAAPVAAFEGAAITALPEGWLWQIGDGARGWAQITVDADCAKDPDTAWRTAGLAPLGTLIVRASELRLSAPELDPALPRLGDAAVAMDPLSGHGMFWALGSALMAGPMAAALLDGQADLAERFYEDRVVETFQRQARLGRDFYRAAGRDGAFWAQRSAWPDALPAEAAPEAPRLDTRVVVRAGRLTEAQVLITLQDPTGAAFVHGVEIAPIVARLNGTRIDATGFAKRILPDTHPETANRIFHWLESRGLTGGASLTYKEVTP